MFLLEMSSVTNTFEYFTYLSRWMYNLAYNTGLNMGLARGRNNGYADCYSRGYSQAKTDMKIYVWTYAAPDQQACVVAREADEARFLIRHAIKTSSENVDRFVRFEGPYSNPNFVDGSWLDAEPVVHHITHPCFVSHLDG